MTSALRQAAQARLDRPNVGRKLFFWIILLGALGVGLYGSGAFDRDLGKKWLIVALAIHAIPVISLALPVGLLRIYGLWFGVLLVLQDLLSPLLLGDVPYYKTLPPNMSLTYQVVGDTLPGIQGEQRITTDAMGFRVQPRIDYEHKRGFRIVAIGASTTEQILLDDRSTWTYLLQQLLTAKTGRPVEVINTGLSGTRALNQLATFRRILDYAPDCALFLVGVNDWNKQIREHFGSDYFRLREAKFKWTLLGRSLVVAHATLMGRLESERYGSLWADSVNAATLRRWVESATEKGNTDSLARSDQRTLTLDHVAPDYHAQIGEIGATCHAAGVPCVFVTQPHGYSPLTDPEYRRHFWMTPPGENYTLDLASMRGIADLYNQYLIRFASEQGHDLVDLAAAMPAGAHFFYDDVHFNTEGAGRVANVLTDALMSGACGFAPKA